MAAAADVGLARIMDTSHLATCSAPCGTFAYAAPELLMGTRCDEKVDIYSFGVVLWVRPCPNKCHMGSVLRVGVVPSLRPCVKSCYM